MGLIDLLKGSFFPDLLSFKNPLLSIIGIVCLLGCAVLQWKLCNKPEQGRLTKYYLAIAFIAVVVIVDFLQLFFKGQDPQFIRDIFGCAVLGLIGFAAAAGIWYIKRKNSGRSGDQQ